jgi:putative oxidoreductase
MNALLKDNGLLRYALAIILLTHSIPAIINNDVSNFGKLYLDEVGFAPFGIYLAWAIKLSHVLCAGFFVVNRFVRWGAAISIFVFAAGIVMVHFPEGWYVVGGGRNGWEYNFLLIVCCVVLFFPKKLASKYA